MPLDGSADAARSSINTRRTVNWKVKLATFQLFGKVCRKECYATFLRDAGSTCRNPLSHFLGDGLP
jgi:hypothetical protein